MSLKVCKNGVMYKIDTNLHKPVVFLNGTKYRLDKACTFINGEKHVLWGETGVQIDYISSTGVLGGGNIFAVGENWLNCYYNKNIYRIDISNLSSPSLIQSVTWGNVDNYNGYQTTSGNMIFTASHTTSGTLTANKMVLTPATGAITINTTGTDTHSYLAQTDNNLVTYNTRTKTFSTTHGSTSIQYGTNFYWNGVLKYSTGREPATASDTSGFLKLSGTALQVAQDSIVFNLVGNYSTGSGLYLGTSSTFSRITDTKNGNLLYDNNLIVREYYNGSISFGGVTPPKTAVSLLDNSSYSALYTYSTDFDNDNTILKLLGRVDNCYYVITMPNNINATTGVKLVLLDKDDLSVVFTRDLPSDPFNENNGQITFWSNCTSILQASQSGYIGVGTFNSSTLGLRVARFSTIF